MQRRHSRGQTVEQESYFVSMTDLMIGLLFIFIILLMAFALSYRDAQEHSEARRDELQATNERLTDNRRTLAHILESIQRSLEERGIQVQIFPDTGVLRLPEDILFDTASAELTGMGTVAVAALAEAMRPVIPCFAETLLITLSAESGAPRTGTLENCPANRHGRLEAIFIEGHTDSRPVMGGRFRSNWDLSTARAIATYEHLRQMLAELEGFRNSHGVQLVGVSGYADTRPVRIGNDPASLAANRRIDLRFVMAAPTGEEPAL